MAIEFRIATREDVPGIVELCNVVFEENTSVEKATRVFDATADDENQIYLVGVNEDGRIVSHIKIALVPTMFDGMDTFAILNHVCVHPDFRREHIASKMLAECEQICRNRGCTSMKLWSKNFRQPAHALYRHYGFESIEATFFEKEVTNEN